MFHYGNRFQCMLFSFPRVGLLFNVQFVLFYLRCILTTCSWFMHLRPTRFVLSTGHTIFAHIRAMITGWEEVEKEEKVEEWEKATVKPRLS